METIITSELYPFLQGGGEMGELTRDCNWSLTALGLPSQWPQSLRTTVGNLLSAKVPMLLWWGDEFIQFYNDPYSFLLNDKTKHSKALGRTGRDCWPEIWNIVYPNIMQVRRTGNTICNEDQSFPINPNGNIEDAYRTTCYSAVIDEEGKISGVLLTCTETIQKPRSLKAHQKIEENEMRFRLLADSMPQFVWTADREGNLNYFNQAVYDYSGLNFEQLQQEGWIQIVHPEERDENITRWLHSIRTGEDFFFHHRFRNRNGEYRWQLSRAIPQKSKEGIIEQWIGTSTNIHDHKLFEEDLQAMVEERTKELESSRQELKRYAQRLAAVFNLAPAGMFTFAPVTNEQGEIIEFRFVITNPSFSRYVGQTPEILKGALGSEWFPGYLQNGVFDMYKKTFLTGDTQRINIHYNVDEHDLYLDLMSAKVGDEVLVIFTDYTQLTKTQLQLEKYIEDLTRSNTNLQEFAYAASHDLKEPIRKIQVFTDRIKSLLANQMTTEQSRYFERMDAASRRMSSLIEDLLLYSEVSLQPGTFVSVNLNELVGQVLEDLDLEIEQKEAKIHVAKLFTLQGHFRQLQQAFQNLVSNALKYSKEGITPEIHIDCKQVWGRDTGLNLSAEEQAQTFYVIVISDNGIGFEQKDAERIFNVFTRLDANTEIRGTGVGLSIVRKVINNHHGYIRAESEPGKGARFELFFPV